MTVNLGDRVKDIVSGFEGVVTGRFSYLNGCVRCQVDPTELKDGRPIDGVVLDEAQLALIERDHLREKLTRGELLPTGGPRETPPLRQPPKR